MQQAQEENQPDWASHTQQQAQAQWRTTRDTLENLDAASLRAPKETYRLLTENANLEPEETGDAALLSLLKREKSPEDKLALLLEEVVDNLESSGLNLKAIYPPIN